MVYVFDYEKDQTYDLFVEDMNVTPHAVSGRRSRPGSVRPAEHELMRAAMPRVLFTRLGARCLLIFFRKFP